ncbi:PREDICTED: uncharacterized protein LOC109330838 [Lupinus angustifolius]|uniref:uncharacterized protein LOC109330838 n=1 Tax=Lupinus angustifolius TaxID=3871 RepID=UPI00092EC986|nr:PREDICTED: uncharacterized protein LOC109330838 [Lupinus angustifolius]
MTNEEGLLFSESSSGNNHSPPLISPTSSITNPCPGTDTSTSIHPMVTRSKNNIFKPKRAFAASNHPLPENLEPSNIREAMHHEHWRKVVSDEFDTLMHNGTWSLVPPPKNKNIVGCKWLLRIKRHPDGFIARYKAHLIPKGFTQCPGFDFKETFAPVV